MHCPYHPDEPAHLAVSPLLDDQDGWIGWLEGCCRLPAWRCPLGALLPVEAQFCTFHGCARPNLGRVAHEHALGDGKRSELPLPSIVERVLDLAPSADGQSTPCLAGNVLAYLTDAGRLVAVDMARDAALYLAAQVEAAALRVDQGRLVGALRTNAGIRYLAWDVRDLRDALATGQTAVKPVPAPATGAHLLGLPRAGGRLHQGVGLLRLVVEHDAVTGQLAELYKATTGSDPGPWLIRRTPNPSGPVVHYPDLRPQALHQVPVPLPGGVLVLGQLRWFGKAMSGALVVPTVGVRDAR